MAASYETQLAILDEISATGTTTNPPAAGSLYQRGIVIWDTARECLKLSQAGLTYHRNLKIALGVL